MNNSISLLLLFTLLSHKLLMSNKLANLLIEYRLKNKLFKELFPIKINDVSNIIHNVIQSERNNPQLGKQVGWKIGATNQIALKKLNLETSFYGPLYSKYCYSNQNVKYINLNDYGIFRAVEAEFCIHMKGDLPLKPDSSSYSIEEVYDQVESIAPSIEISSTRFDCITIDTPTVLSDFAMNGCCIIGDKVDKPISYQSLIETKASLVVNNIEISSAFGNSVLENPINALAILANQLNNDGYQLSAGDIVMTGACCICKVNIGDQLSANFYNMGITPSVKSINIRID